MSAGTHRQWAVLVDGSSVAAKAFDAACLFLAAQNGKEGQDSLTVVHAVDPRMDLNKPQHLQGSFIISSYETNLIRARRIYDGHGPHRLKARVLLKEYNHASGGVEVSHRDLTKKVDNVEHAPALVAALLKCSTDEIAPHYIFVGSFGEGGIKAGQHGTVTDYLVRLTNATTFIVNHWRPFPKPGESVTMVVAVDGGPTCLKALEQILKLSKKNDKVIALIVSQFKGPHDEEIIAQVNQILAQHKAIVPDDCSCQWRALEENRGPAAKVICDAAEALEADFLVIGSCNLTRGALGRESIPLLGSTALFCSHNAKCHVIVVKPSTSS